MLRVEPPSLLDWIAVSLRWLALLALAVTAGRGGAFDLELALVYLLAALWNVILTVLAALLGRARFFRLVNVCGDLVVAGLLFHFGGGANGLLPWAGVLPVISAALYYRLPGGALLAALTVMLQAALTIPVAGMPRGLLLLASLLGVYLGLGLGLGFISIRLTQLLELAQMGERIKKEKLERQERQRSRAIYRAISGLNASLNYQRVLDMALDAASSTLEALGSADDQLISAVLLYTNLDGQTELRAGSARRFTTADLRINLPGTAGLLGKAIDERQPQLSQVIASDPELSRIVALRTAQSAYCIPLSSGLDAYGVLLFAHPDGDFFSADRREILDVIGTQAMVAIQNARLFRDLELEKERITEIQEDARKKLARDLHDGPTQSVAALAMRTNFARRLIEKDVQAASEELYKIEDLARRTTKEIRHMLFTLRPLVLESQGLVAALQSMAIKMYETYSQVVLIEADEELVAQIEASKQSIIFYIAEEAVNNARKHAQAGKIWVRIKPAGQDLALLEIEDNGVGFDQVSVQNNYEQRGSLGMINMRERAELISGLLQLDSTPGKGTRIRVLAPLSEDAAERLRRGR